VFYENIFAGFSISVFLLVLFLATKGKGMGLGDVKLVIIPGMVMGMLLSWVFIFVSFLVGGIIGVILIILGKAKLGKEIPFAPFLVVSFYITLFWSQTILDILKLHL
jgi:leader peptidase (prepilin peptidase)/N-methyltransferase